MPKRVSYIVALLAGFVFLAGCGQVTSSSDGTSNPSAALPVADAGSDQTTESLASITLDGSGSTGSNLIYAWSQSPTNPVQVAISQDASVAASVSLSLEGDYVFYLNVHNDAGSSTDNVRITFSDPTMHLM